ncbi:MAG: HlyC/CorC family transporter [Proteobacteria bacterium]|nr:HlyC/CorC family transporter [Pseudomonadota bacterium]
MNAHAWLSIAAVFVCLVLSFFFSASETALTASSRAAMLRLAKEGQHRAKIVNLMLETRERMIGTLLLSNNIVNITASALTTGLLYMWFGEVGVVYATIVMTVVVVIFTEVLPKTVAINRPDRVALLVAPLIHLIVRALAPAVAVIEAIVRFILNHVGFRLGAHDPLLPAHEELRGAVDIMHREGTVEKHDRDMLGGLLDLRDLVVSDVMIHRTEMITANAADAPEAIIKAVLAAGKTRIPLWRNSPENIAGIIHARDLLLQIEAMDGDFSKVDIDAIMRPPWFVPDIRPVSEQLKAFRRRKTPFALVVDEYGEVMGLVTLADILAEIIGDVSDEHDVVVSGVRPHSDGSVDVDGAVPIRDLNRAMEWNLPDHEATTVAGLVIHDARSIPEPGQSFIFHGFRFHVLKKYRNRITALRVMPLARKPAARVG